MFGSATNACVPAARSSGISVSPLAINSFHFVWISPTLSGAAVWKSARSLRNSLNTSFHSASFFAKTSAGDAPVAAGLAVAAAGLSFAGSPFAAVGGFVSALDSSFGFGSDFAVAPSAGLAAGSAAGLAASAGGLVCSAFAAPLSGLPALGAESAARTTPHETNTNVAARVKPHRSNDRNITHSSRIVSQEPFDQLRFSHKLVHNEV